MSLKAWGTLVGLITGVCGAASAILFTFGEFWFVGFIGLVCLGLLVYSELISPPFSPTNKTIMSEESKITEDSKITEGRPTLPRNEGYKISAPDPEGEVPPVVAQTKEFRKELDVVLQRMKFATMPNAEGRPHPTRCSRERALAVTKLQEAIMWLGMDLKAMREEGISGEPSPYPGGYSPDSADIPPPSGVVL